MLSQVSQNLNSFASQGIVFRAKNKPISPIEDTQKIIEGKVDSVVQTIEEDRKKKSYKRAVAVGIGVVLTTGLVAVLNPKMSGKTLEKLKTKIELLQAEGKRVKDDFMQSKWNKLKIKSYKTAVKFGEISNNFNNGKDLLWKKLCVEKKDFSKIKFKPLKWVLEKIDSAWVFLMKKPHELMTKFFDKITKHTVKAKYKAADKQIGKLNDLISKYKSSLPENERRLIDEKLRQIETLRLHFGESAVEERLLEQEEIMETLEGDLKQSFSAYFKNIKNSKTVKGKLKTGIDDMEFFSEKLLQDKKDALGKNGTDFVESLIKKESAQNGIYDEIVEILSPHLTEVEKTALSKSMKNASKKMYRASFCENSEYFDKKRDLMLGGAPTDVLSALFGLGMAGYAVGNAKDKNEKINRTIAVGAPAVLAVGTSLTFTSLLFTGVKNMIVSGGIGFLVSRIGSIIANKITGEKDEIVEDGEPFLLSKSV